MELNKIYNQDCVEGMRDIPDKFFELVIADPPYFKGPNKTGYYGKGFSSLSVKRAKDYTDLPHWEVPNAEYFKELKRVSKNQIIWGANHFAGQFDSSGSRWIVWDKVNGASTFADAELAYTSFPGAVRTVRFMWDGMRQGKSLSEGHIMQGNKDLNEKRIHPTQKPVVLYKWLLTKFAKPGDKILDTHAGSCSSVIACIDLGFDYLAYELDSQMFKKATKRVLDYQRQIRIPFAG